MIVLGNRSWLLGLALLVALSLTSMGCDIQPPDYVPRETRTVPEAAGAFSALPSLADSTSLQDMQRKGYFKYGTPLAAPYSFVRPGPNDFLGINADLASIIAVQLGFPSPLVQLQRWPQMPRDLESGSVDMIIGAPVSRPDFDDLAFVPIGERGHCLLMRADEERFEEMSDVTASGVTFSVVNGTDAAYYLETNYPDVKLKRKDVATAEETVYDLLDGEVDVTPVFSLVAPVILEKYPSLKTFPTDCTEQPVWTSQWGISLRDDDPSFQEFLESLVNSLKETGWFEEKTMEWTNSPLLQRALLAR